MRSLSLSMVDTKSSNTAIVLQMAMLAPSYTIVPPPPCTLRP